MRTQPLQEMTIEPEDSPDLLIKSIEILPDQIVKNVETIALHQDQHQQNSTAEGRVLNQVTAIFRRPGFLYSQMVFFLVWGVCSHLAREGFLPSDFPLFDVRDEGLDVASLLISTGVLIYQTRQEELSEERSHLMLQLNLLTEQKIAKLISLVEELRTDLPNVKNRNDLEADAMKQATDPQVILDALQQKLDPAVVANRSP